MNSYAQRPSRRICKCEKLDVLVERAIASLMRTEISVLHQIEEQKMELVKKQNFDIKALFQALADCR